MHQCLGLGAFNGLPYRRALHALYECCNSVPMATELVRGRPYPSRSALFRRADAVLFELPEDGLEEILQAYPRLDSRPGSAGYLTLTRAEIALLNRSRLERMLGPEGGYDNWY